MAGPLGDKTVPARHSSVRSKYKSGNFSGSVFLISAEGQVLNLPIPTNSSLDPLNWTKMKQARAFLALYVFCITGNVLMQGPTYLLDAFRNQFSEAQKPFRIENVVSAPKLFMGIGAFIWIPLSLAIGRRPVFLLCNVILFLFTILAASARTFHQLLISICFQGLAQGAGTSLVFLMVIDITFIHQRPQAIAMLWCVVGSITSTLLATIPRAIKPTTTWRIFHYSWAIPALLSLLLAFFFYPETYFIRPPVAFNGRILVQSATEKVRIYEDWEEVPGGKALPETPNQRPWIRDLKFRGITWGGWKAMRGCYSQVLGCLVNPLIFWVALLNACVLASMLSISETYVEILKNPRYNLSRNACALIHMAGAIGALVAYPVSGCLTASVTCRLTIRNHGVRDAEHYLPAFILPIITGIVNIVIYGVAAEYKWHYMWIYFAYGLSVFTFISLSTANILWVTEAFPRWAAPALVVISGGSNIASFGISFGIMPWIRSQGQANADIEIGVLIAVIGLVAVPIAFWGKDLRQHIHERWGTSQLGALRPQ
ncbi:major facilitator superfamily transporter [Leptodontidium sp. 2 PMI_412]|nr:major facilitator superfamily transporter [Leptodontidium sp. 2 PMI_412]